MSAGERRRSAQAAAAARWGKTPDPYIRDEITGDPIGTIKPIDTTGVFVVTPSARCAMGAECTHPDCNDTPPKTTRPLPRPGSNNAAVLALLRGDGHYTTVTLSNRSGLTMKETSRALVALRAGGHVVSEGKRPALTWRRA